MQHVELSLYAGLMQRHSICEAKQPLPATAFSKQGTWCLGSQSIMGLGNLRLFSVKNSKTYGATGKVREILRSAPVDLGQEQEEMKQENYHVPK